MIPYLADLPSIAVANAVDDDGDLPAVPARSRDARPTVGRARARPGLEHRIGGLEKADVTGNVSYDPDNHHRMQLLRAAKVAGIANDIPPLEVFGPGEGRSADPRLGLDLRRDPFRGGAPAGRRPLGRARPPAPPQPVPGQHGGGPAELPPGAHPGGQPGPAPDARPGEVPHRRRRLRPRPRQAVPHRRDRRGGRTGPGRGDARGGDAVAGGDGPNASGGD